MKRPAGLIGRRRRRLRRGRRGGRVPTTAVSAGSARPRRGPPSPPPAWAAGRRRRRNILRHHRGRQLPGDATAAADPPRRRHRPGTAGNSRSIASSRRASAGRPWAIRRWGSFSNSCDDDLLQFGRHVRDQSPHRRGCSSRCFPASPAATCRGTAAAASTARRAPRPGCRGPSGRRPAGPRPAPAT